MAPFNPQINPINDPNWTGVSRPISDVPSDKSKALSITTAAEGLDTGVKVAESIDQDIIKEKTRAGVESLQQATTLAYENVRGSLIQGTNPDPQAANVAGLSLIKQAQADVPDALQSGLDRAQDLATARAQGTLKANDTLYTGALNSLAKQLRSEYPGHKDFIDEQIARISGKNPANAYMDNLMSDISRLSTNTDAFEKKLVSKAWENMGDLNVANAIVAYRNKVPGAMESLFKAVNGAESEKLNHTKTMNNFSEQEAAGKVDTDLVKYQAQQSAQNTAQRVFNGVVEQIGLKPSKISELLNEYRSTGKISSIPPQQWESMAQALEASRDAAANQIKNNFNQYGVSRRLKDPAAEKAIIDNELQVYDRAIAAIRSPEKGMFFEAQRRAKGLQDQAGYQALSGPMGDWLTKSKVIQDHVGPQWVDFVNRQGLAKNYLGKMQDFFTDASQRIAVPDDIRKDGNLKSLTNDISTAKKAAAQGTTFDPRLYDDLVKNVDMITSANNQGRPDIAKEVVKYMYDPKRNADFVKQWSRDFTDDKNIQHKGYFTYYDMLTQPKVVDGIYALGDTEAKNMYHNWNEHQFRQIFGREVEALNTIQGDKANPATMEWNTTTNQMTLKFANKPATTVDQTYQAWAQNSISNLNKGLANLGYMFKKENQDPSEGIFTTLMQLSYKPREGLSGQLPKMVIDAINTTQFQPSAEERLRGAFERTRGQ